MIKTKAIVLKEVQLRESDKILTCISGELGRFSLSARGVRSHKSGNIAAASFLAYSDMMLYSSRNMYSLGQSNVIESFYPIRKDVIKLTYASYFADILMDTVQENEESNNIMRLLLNTLYYLSKDEANEKYLSILFVFRLLRYLGYDFDPCDVCSECEGEPADWFSARRGSLVCRKCKDSHDVPMTTQQTGLLCRILKLPLKQAFEYKPEQDILDGVREISARYLTTCLDKRYTKLDFLDTL